MVVFPAPLGPRNPWTSPTRTSRSSRSSARVAPNDFTRSAIEIAIDIVRDIHYFHNYVKMMERGIDKRDARVAFIGRFASALAESGFPRMPARVFAALVASDSGALTSAQLADLLRVSPAAISGAIRYLVQVNLASRETERGSRREVYRVHNEVWYEAVASKDRTLERCERSLREGIDAIGRHTPAGKRIAETIAFFDFLKVELPKLLERWRQSRVPIASSHQRRETRGFEREPDGKHRTAGRRSAARS